MHKLSLSFVLVLLLSIHANCQSAKDSTTSDGRIEIDDKVFIQVEQEATFPGGIQAWIQYLQDNLNASVPVKKKAPAGQYQVIVKFIVSKTGKVTGIAAETNHGYGMEKEVIRIIKKGPNWIPAMQNGKPVNAYRRQPVTFSVEEE